MDYSQLVESLRAANLVAFIGAGVSLPYKNTHGDKHWIGLPSASMLVKIMADRRPYISAEMSFPQACFMFKRREGRGELEAFLLEHLDKPVLKPLPAHTHLANLGFSSFVSVNYDTLLERALIEARRQTTVVIEDRDVARIRAAHTTIIKYHGCVSRPNTMVAAADEYRPIAEAHPIIDALLRTLLANKALLFLGFSLADEDFRSVFQELKHSLGEHMPRSFAVVRSADDYTRSYWETQGLIVIEDDLTTFLRGLMRASYESPLPAIYRVSEDWLHNEYFESLHQIRTRPSETQAIDAFLGHLQNELQVKDLDLEDTLNNATRAVSMVLSQRPNLEAFRLVAETVIWEIRDASGKGASPELVLEGILQDRGKISLQIKSYGRTIIERNDSILLYSQSKRVVQLLEGVAKGVQATCHVYLAECRPKSPAPFQDAIAMAAALRGGNYEVTLVPDAAIGNLIQRSQIKKIIIGAHAVFCEENTPRFFVNTAGSHLLMCVSRYHRIPVYVVAEKAKIVALDPIMPTPNVSYQEEENLFTELGSDIGDLKAEGMKIQTLNIGYDLCEFDDNVHLLTEAGIWSS